MGRWGANAGPESGDTGTLGLFLPKNSLADRFVLYLRISLGFGNSVVLIDLVPWSNCAISWGKS